MDLWRTGGSRHPVCGLLYLCGGLMSGLEIEKKFLVRNHSYQTQNSGQSHIQQGYICSDRGRTVRVRIRDDRGYLTIKGPSSDNGLSRYEFEKEIDPDEAQELMKLCEKSEETGKPLMIDKTRYLVKSGRHTFEVDEFHGENEGLVVAEVELHSEDEDYLLPDFINKEDEVTGDRKYYNSQLLKHPFSTWPKDGESAVR